MGDGGVARAFHEATKHTVTSVRSGGRSMDWENKPHPFKVYEPDLPSVSLPTPERHQSLGIAGLSRILGYGAGVLRKRDYAGETLYFRTYASAGALYPVEIYIVVGDIEGLPGGVYHFDPLRKALGRLRTDDLRGAVVAAASDEPSLAHAEVLVVLTGIPWRTCWKYGERGYRHLWWDAGTILSNILALSASAGLTARIVLGFDDSAVSSVLDVDGVREFPLCVVALGTAGGPPPPGRVPKPLGLAVRALSPHEERFALLEGVHEAGRLGRDEVGPWRVDGDAGGSVAPDWDGVERVIRRRGSARRFGRRPIPADDLREILLRATAGIPTDYEPIGSRLARPYLAVHAVEGLQPGVYAWEDADLQPLRRGDVRLDAAYLCLGQRLGGEGAATFFLMAELENALRRFGDRGYRVGQLEGGIALGRIDLASHALGWGATGLTFFDDDVVSYFSPHASGCECMLAGAVGERRGALLPLA